ncbi:MAG: Dabb family protein [Sciscionella sp.]
MTLQHVVLFQFPSELSAAEDAEMRAQIAAWPREIPGIRALRFGKDLTGERTSGYASLLYMELDDAQALADYQVHPTHRRFQDWLRARSATVLGFDYHLDEHTVIPTG